MILVVKSSGPVVALRPTVSYLNDPVAVTALNDPVAVTAEIMLA